MRSSRSLLRRSHQFAAALRQLPPPPPPCADHVPGMPAAWRTGGRRGGRGEVVGSC